MVESREVALARKLYELKARGAALAAEIKAVSELCEVAEQELMDYLVTAGKSSTGHIDGVGTFTLRRENYPSVAKSEMPRFLAYLRQVGDGAMIEETVHAQTLKSYCKTRLTELTEKFAESDEEAAKAISALKLPATEFVPPAELAKQYMARFGVTTFQKLTLSITKKGK